MIIREEYLKKIRSFYKNIEFIKVLVGMRRTGKSTILKQIVDEIKKDGVDDSKIIYINFESLQFFELRNYMNLYNYVKDKVKSKELHYIFIDEIQNVKGFERAINSMKVDLNVSIFITGSNSNLLSGELATHLAGRYREFKIYPYSFNEWLQSKNEIRPNKELLTHFLKEGGLPQISKLNNEFDKKEAISDILNSIIYKDILERANVKNIELLKRFIYYLIDNSSELISIKSISNYFKSVKMDVRIATLYEYLGHITNSMLIYECKKNDIKGKGVLTKINKMYVNDLGLKQIIQSTDSPEYSKMIETAVFNHLKYLGYEITCGSINGYEIDFVAKHIHKPKKYIQVSYRMISDENTIEREFRPFSLLEDSYERFVITMDDDEISRNGVKHIKLIDFLSNDNF